VAYGRVYSAIFNDVAVSAAQDLFELVAGANVVVELLEVHLSQQTEIGDAMEENLNILIKSGQTTSGSTGGTNPTPANISTNAGSEAAESTVEINNTTKASAGTIVTHVARWWNVRMPFDLILTPETTIILAPSRRLTVELVAAPGDSIDMSGEIVFKEYGGS
jgi:hypothetical protein